MRVAFLVATLGVGLAFAACGSSGGGDATPDSDASTSTSSGDPPPIAPPPSGFQDAEPIGADALESCAKETVQATVRPLDVLVLFDTSDSMNDPVAVGVTKYKAVSQAVNAFVTDARSAGIGAGLTFFPVDQAGSPASCTPGSCGAFGICSANICEQNGPTYFCTDKTQCANGAKCSPAGRCSNRMDQYCTTLGAACPSAPGSLDPGTCLAQNPAYCTGSDSCTVADYSTPVLPIQPLPGAASGFTTAFANHATPRGKTPTYAALQGAYKTLQDWHTAHPDHALALIFATDGIPDECNPSNVTATNIAAMAKFASDALASPAQIHTFVVGLFTTQEAINAKPNMDQIAAAGGGGSAYIVAPDGTTSTKVLDALDAIRGAAIPCDYAIPTPEAGTADFNKLNIAYTPAGGASVVFPNRKDAATCDANGGWYYDVDPKTGTPTRAILCPVTCSGVNAQSGAIDVVIGCQTIIR